jgi:hypothetical protein
MTLLISTHRDLRRAVLALRRARSSGRPSAEIVRLQAAAYEAAHWFRLARRVGVEEVPVMDGARLAREDVAR